MKLKSYLRGLGIGIIVTTIILVIAFNGRNKTMTDADVIARAKALGMVETSMYGNGEKQEGIPDGETNEVEISGEGMLSVEDDTKSEETTSESDIESVSGIEVTDETETTTEEATTPEEITSQEVTFEEVTFEEATSQEETTSKESVSQEETTKTTETSTGEEIVLVFENITSATKASNILYEAGVIQNIESFNSYLSEQGLATKICEGTFTFRKGMSFEEIAKIITKWRP